MPQILHKLPRGKKVHATVPKPPPSPRFYLTEEQAQIVRRLQAAKAKPAPKQAKAKAKRPTRSAYGLPIPASASRPTGVRVASPRKARATLTHDSTPSPASIANPFTDSRPIAASPTLTQADRHRAEVERMYREQAARMGGAL